MCGFLVSSPGTYGQTGLDPLISEVSVGRVSLGGEASSSPPNFGVICCARGHSEVQKATPRAIAIICIFPREKEGETNKMVQKSKNSKTKKTKTKRRRSVYPMDKGKDNDKMEKKLKKKTHKK